MSPQTMDLTQRLKGKVAVITGGGSGIGLLDAKTTIERIGGNFLLQSVEGRGTTATIVLPAHLSLVPTTPGLDHLQYEPNFRGA